MAAMYVSGLLTDWYVPSFKSEGYANEIDYRRIVSTSPMSPGTDDEPDVYIGRSEAAMWMRVVSSWVCIAIYSWSL
jgi:hypothetical protein